ncbi:MAG: type II toxin-antitoxin system Phd/YefM family antitoxin [Propionibacteriaceae bacterium]|nr:type II toxin-antitoxin system Phd/YefM family antitoxin [Propionibacteriaceae bacterium]
MTEITVSEARATLPALIDIAHREAVILTRRGKAAGVLISPEAYERMMAALEEAEDVAAFDEAMAEEGNNIPWDLAKADLGLA